MTATGVTTRDVASIWRPGAGAVTHAGGPGVRSRFEGM